MPETTLGSPIETILTTDGNTIEPALSYIDGGEHVNTMPCDHRYLHEGTRYLVSTIDIALADDDVILIQIDVGSTLELHMFAQVSAGGDATLELLEGATTDDDGDAMTAYCYNRDETAAASATFAQDPTNLTGGTALMNGGLLIAGGTGGNAGGGAAEGRDEFILKLDTTYVYRVTNIAGAAKAVSVALDFYEHEPITGVA